MHVLMGGYLQSVGGQTHINDITVNFFTSLLYKSKRFHVAVHLFSNRSQMTSKCGEN